MKIEIIAGAENNPVAEFFSSSNTPETDNLARGNHVVPTEWAQKLERERDEALKKLKPPAWIAVSQALPDDDSTVLVHMDDGEIWTGFLDAGAWRFVSGDRIDCPVLHWRPFPDAPTH